MGIQGNGWSQPVISWSDVDAWARLTRQDIEPREALTIIILGNRRAAILSEKADKTDGGKG